MATASANLPSPPARTVPPSTGGGRSPQEADRQARLRQGRVQQNRLPEMPVQNRERRSSTGEGPVFGEEGFGDLESARRQKPAADRPETDREGESADEGTAEQGGARVRERALEARRQQARQTQQKQQENAQAEEQQQDGIGGLDTLVREQLDTLVNAGAYFIPVLGHWLWWNVRMFYGSWIAKGKSRIIGPFGWDDVILVFLPIKTGSKVAGQAATKLLPDSVAQLLLVFIDLWIFISMTLMLAIMVILLYFLYMVMTDLVGTLIKFSGFISSFI